MNAYGYLHLCACVIYISMAVILHLKDMRSPLTRIAAIIFCFFALWSFCFTFIHNPRTPHDIAAFMLNVSGIGGVPTTSIFMYFVIKFTQRKFPLWHKRLVAAFLIIIPVILFAMQWLVGGILVLDKYNPQSYGWATTLQNTPWTYVYYLYTYGLAVIGFFMMAEYGVRNSDRIVRRQTAIIIGSALLAMFCNGAMMLCSEWVGGPLPYMLDVAFLIWAAGMLFAIIRYQLFSLTPAAAAESIIELLSDALLIVNAHGRITRHNKAARILFCGPDGGNVINRPLSDFLEGERSVLNGSPDGDSTGRLMGIEAQCRCADGSLRPMLFSQAVLRDSLGRTQGTICLLHDISDLRRLEREVVDIESREQLRIGQDLHDGLGQLLAGSAFRAKALESKAGSSGVSASDIAEVTRLINTAASQVQVLAKGLSPVDTREEGLTVALQALAQSTCNLFGIRCTFDGSSSFVTPNQVMATHLYRIAQEAVTNAAKHSGAHSIAISLHSTADGILKLTVRDDGAGIGPSAMQNKGMGMRTMLYRSRTIGATFDIFNDPAGGTVVACSVAAPVSIDRKVR